ncbi:MULTISPECIES: M48 family metalloprotease [unclassified Bradyrhizobium]
MCFLDWPIEVQQAARKADARRKRLTEELVVRFARKFPQITYTLIWDSPLINAQAWRLGEQRNVYLYGGFVRQPAITRAGLALALAHETGHHLGGAPYDPAMTWMTSEAQADHWAAVSGMPSLFGSRAKRLTLRGACEIAVVQRQCQCGANSDDKEVNERVLQFYSSIQQSSSAGIGESKWER